MGLLFMIRSIKLSELTVDKSFSVIGDDVTINGLNLVKVKSEYDNILSYVTDDTYLIDIVQNPKISALIVPVEYHAFYDKNISRNITYLLTDSPEELFYSIHDFLLNKTDFYEKFDFQSSFGFNTSIHKSAVIYPGVILGANSVIHSGVIIEDSVTIGCNTSIGAQGFQIIKKQGTPQNIYHVGRTRIGSNSNIGNNCVIDNGLFEGYVDIGESVMIGSLCNISHNCIIEKKSVITAGVILCGSVRIEENVWIGMNATVLNKVVISKGSRIGIGSVVTRDISKDVIAYGSPAKAKRKI
jgi:UDP-3-O-[3-hydroxymyristoyl] glucosamine N-acyltransferase